MIAYPNCKINLGLQVVGRRPDGYHDLRTIFLPVHSLRDELEITELPREAQQAGRETTAEERETQGTERPPLPSPSSGGGVLAHGSPSPSSGGGVLAHGSPSPSSGGGVLAYGSPSPSSGGEVLAHGSPSPSSGDGVLAHGRPSPSSGGGVLAHGSPSPSSSGGVLAPRMIQEGLALDNAPEDNLCLRAWQLLHDEFGIPPVLIRLRKVIPFGAGLGGGSSDAAFTLRMLNEMYSLGLTAPQLELRAARLGADCAFFVRDHAAYATGIGDQLQPMQELSILNSPFSIKIEIPDGEHVSTREAYMGLDRALFGMPRPDLREAVRHPVEEWRDLITNDFEASVFPAHPAIAALKAEMYRRGALYASMTGSGAAVFGFFPKQ